MSVATGAMLVKFEDDKGRGKTVTCENLKFIQAMDVTERGQGLLLIVEMNTSEVDEEF